MSRTLRIIAVGFAIVVVAVVSVSASFNVGAPRPNSQFVSAVATSPASPIYYTNYSGKCPTYSIYLNCYAVSSTPSVSAGTWNDEIGFVGNDTGAPCGVGGCQGVISITGGFKTTSVTVPSGTQAGFANWSESWTWAGLASIFASIPCPGIYSLLWVNITSALTVFTNAGVAAGTTSTTVITPGQPFGVVGSAGCSGWTTFNSGNGPSTVKLVAPFTSAHGGVYFEETSVDVVATLDFTGDTCMTAGVAWSTSPAWTWPTVSCVGRTVPVPPSSSTAMQLSSSSIT